MTEYVWLRCWDLRDQVASRGSEGGAGFTGCEFLVHLLDHKPSAFFRGRTGCNRIAAILVFYRGAGPDGDPALRERHRDEEASIILARASELGWLSATQLATTTNPNI